MEHANLLCFYEKWRYVCVLVYNFVDFRKAFDSLDEQGMPKKIVSIIKDMYDKYYDLCQTQF